VGAHHPKLLKRNLAGGRVRDLVADDLARELRDEVHVGAAGAPGEIDVARARAGRGVDRVELGGGQVLADGVEAQLIGAQVGHDDELLGRVEEGLVRARGTLTVRVGGRLGGLERLRLDVDQVGGVRDVPRREGRAAAAIASASLTLQSFRR